MTCRSTVDALRNVLSVAVCAVAALLTWSCDDAPSAPLPNTNNMVQVGFTITVNDSYGAAASRAPYEDGDRFENYIAFDSFDISFMLFDQNGKFVEHLNVLSMPTSADAEKRVVCSLNAKPRAPFKIMALANCGGIALPPFVPGTTTIEEMCGNYSYTYTAGFVPSENTPIPMWGVLTSDKELTAGVVTDIGTLEMLRALAKIEVRCKDNSLLKLKSVTLNRLNDKGFLLPGKDDALNNTVYVTTPNIPSDAAQTASASFRLLDAHTGVIYVPEFRNIGADEPCSINVTFDYDETEVNTISFCMYDNNGKPTSERLDVLRNCIYRFTVGKTTHDEFIVDVMPFTGVELPPEYGIVRDDSTGYIKGKDNQNRDCWYDNGVPYYLGPKDSHGNFVTIRDKQYLLVYTNYERNADALHHIYDKSTGKNYFLDVLNISGYRTMTDHTGAMMYVNKMEQRVWLDNGGNPNGTADEQAIYQAFANINLQLRGCRIIYEWDRMNWNKARWWGWPGVYPSYWFDVFGNRYPWSEGQTIEMRKEKLKEKLGEEWLKYLDDSEWVNG